MAAILADLEAGKLQDVAIWGPHRGFDGCTFAPPGADPACTEAPCPPKPGEDLPQWKS